MYEVSPQLMQTIANYLAKQPYSEVAGMIGAIQALKIKELPKEKK